MNSGLRHQQCVVLHLACLPFTHNRYHTSLANQNGVAACVSSLFVYLTIPYQLHRSYSIK
jgi:hypothetical protein